jgi:multisubunit Na+/H+ antiporter MnhC subunit
VAGLWRGSLGHAGDGFAQAVVSGLAHHATALVIGYALTLLLLAIRQVALRHHGTIRGSARTGT